MAIRGASSVFPVIDQRREPAAPPAAIAWQRATITKILHRTSTVSSFWFKPEKPFAFIAGQHVDVRLTAPDGYSAQRSYSIASAPEHADSIELTIERLPTGEVSPFFHEVAEIGDEIELRGPLGGYFVWSTADGGPLLLVGGASGVVPLVAMIRHRALQGSMVPTLLLFSARSWDDVIFRDELLALHDQHNGFELVLTLTREPPRRPGDYGRRVGAAMMAELVLRLPALPANAFICGSNPFVEAAAQGLIDAGVATGMVRTERYGV